MAILTDKAVKALQPKDKLYRTADGSVPGLCIEVSPQGSKRWRYRFQRDGKASMVSLGIYPEVSIKDARWEALEFQKKLALGEVSASRKSTPSVARGAKFQDVAAAWMKLEKSRGTWGDTRETALNIHLRYLCGIGELQDVDVSTITSAMLHDVAIRIEEAKSSHVARCCMSLAVRVLHHAFKKKLIENIPFFSAKDSLDKAPPTTHHHAITDPREIPELLAYIDNTISRADLREYFQLMAMTFCRATELRLLTWSEVDWDNRLLRIPAERMKMNRDHIVPLSDQAYLLLKRHRDNRRGDSEYVFLGMRGDTCMGSAALIDYMQRGFKGRMTTHGFRAMASTLLNERGWSPDVIEAQLAHQERNAVRRAYNRAQYLDERRKMMQEWSDYLDELREKGKASATKKSMAQASLV